MKQREEVGHLRSQDTLRLPLYETKLIYVSYPFLLKYKIWVAVKGEKKVVVFFFLLFGPPLPFSKSLLPPPFLLLLRHHSASSKTSALTTVPGSVETERRTGERKLDRGTTVLL